MNFGIEWAKMKRSGFVPAFLAGGALGAFVPVIQMAVRSENDTGFLGKPLEILLEANWSMIAMLNVMLIVAGACMMYHIEYEERGIQKIRTLPTKEWHLTAGKFLILMIASFGALVLETVGLGGCGIYWFEISEDFFTELLKNMGYVMVLTLPTVIIMLMIASWFQNMWISLGIGVLCVFTATMRQTDNGLLSLFPFAMPFQTVYEANVNDLIAAAAEVIAFAMIGWGIEKIRKKTV